MIDDRYMVKPPLGSSRIARMIRLPLTFRYLLQFLAISFLCLGANELVHHVVARAGGWPVLALVAGPMLTWLLIWGGRAMILHGEGLAGLTLVLANLPLARLVAVLLHRGDEMVVANTLLPGNGLWIPMVLLTLLLLWSPLVTSYRALGHRHRARLMAALLVLSLAWDALLKQVWLTRLIEIHPTTVAGIPAVALVAYAAAILLLVLLRRPAPPPDIIVTKSGRYAAIMR